MIIVEGPDGAGKTTLVSQIETDWGLTREPRAVSSDAVSLVPIGEYIEKELDKGFGMRLYDRFGLISSPMYTMLPNRTMVEPMTNVAWLGWAYWKMHRLNPVIIWCMPPLEVVLENVANDESSKVMKDHAEVIYLNYLTFIARDFYNTSSMIYDYTEPNLPRLASLLRWADGRTKQERGVTWKTSSS